MASNLGNIYVQLQLDDKLYKQKLSETLGDAQATTKGLETAWKSLGVKTNQYFDDQRKAAENAYSLILKSGKYSADEIVRAEKAKNDKINAANEQQFGKQEGMLTKLKNNWVAAAATIGAAYMTAMKAWNLAEQAAKYEQSAAAFHSMATSMGKDATAEFKKIREASGGLIDTQALTEATNKALSLGIPIENIADLMIIARAKARDMGTDTSKAFSDIATGVGRASPLILDNLGLTLKVGTANEEMAKSLGKTVAELTDQEKKTAILNATLAAGKEAVERYDLSQKTTAENMQALKVTLSDLQLMLGQGIVRAAALVVGAFQSISAASLTVSSYIWKIIEAKERLQAMVSWGEAEKRHMEAAGQAASNAASDFKASLEYAKKAQDNFSLMTSRTEDMAGAMIKTTKATGETAKAVDTATGSTKELADEHSKMVKKQIEDEEKLRKKYDDVNEELESGTRETYNQIYNIQQDEHTKGLKLISEQRDKYEKLGADRETLAKWTKAQIEKLENDLNEKTLGLWRKQEEEWIRITTAEVDAAVDANTKKIAKLQEYEKAVEDHQGELEATVRASYERMPEHTDTFFDSVKKGWERAKEDCGTWASNAENAIKTFADSSKSAISTTLFDFIKTGTADLKTIWTSFGDSMLKSFTDTVGAMATKFMTGFLEQCISAASSQDIVVTFKALWDTASAVVLAGIKALQSFFSYEGGYVRESGVGAYADGGMIPGYATGGDSKANDTVLSWLSPGEYVMPRTAVNAETIPYLEYMRKNKRPRYYADGGIIDPLQTYSDDYAALEEPYKNIYTSAGLYYYNGQWGLLSGWGEDDKGNAGFTTFTPVSDPVSYAGKWLNETGHYNLQDENDPPQALDQADYKYLLDWYVSANELMNTGGDWDPGSVGIRTSALTGVTDPNVIWTEPEGSGYRFYFRDGSEKFRDPSESNWLKRFMPSIIKAVGAVAAVAIATAAALPTGGASYGILSGITAAIQGGMASAAALAGAAGAGLYSAFVNYGETGSVTGAIIAGIISAAATALSFGSPWAESETGLMVLKSEMAPSGYLTAAQGRVIADVIRKGGGAVLQETINSVAGGGGSMALEKSGSSGGLGEMEALYNALPDLMSGSFSLRSGLDYVPYDNFPARLHKGEAVLTAEENKSGRGDIILNFNLNGTVIDRKAVNEFAELIYPRLQKLQAWGH